MQIKPCPFCGGEEMSVYNKSRYEVAIKCHTCGAQSGWLPATADAIAAWNRRSDAVPVVRCRECRSYDATGFPALNPGTGWCDKMGKGVHNEFYCANGAKMEDKT